MHSTHSPRRPFCASALASYSAFLPVYLVLAAAPREVTAGDTYTGPPPAIVIWQHPGNVPADRSDLQIAIWDDGVVLMWKAVGNGDPPETRLMRGKCDPKAVAKLIEEIRASKFAELPHDYVLLCAGATAIVVRMDDKTYERKWHGSRGPGGGDVDKDPQYAAFVKTFEHVRDAIRRIEPADLQRVKLDTDGPTFRGYDLKEPRRTPWAMKK